LRLIRSILTVALMAVMVVFAAPAMADVDVEVGGSNVEVDLGYGTSDDHDNEA